MLQEAGTQPLHTYIEKRQVEVAEWLDLWNIFEVCTKETGYNKGGRLQDPWWRQVAAEKQLKATLKDVPAAVGNGGDGDL